MIIMSDMWTIAAIVNLIIRTSRMTPVGTDCLWSLYQLTFSGEILLSDIDKGLLGVTLSDFSCFLTQYSALDTVYSEFCIQDKPPFGIVYGRVRDFLMPWTVQMYRPDPYFPCDWTSHWVTQWDSKSGKWDNSFFNEKYANWYK